MQTNITSFASPRHTLDTGRGKTRGVKYTEQRAQMAVTNVRHISAGIEEWRVCKNSRKLWQ